ncbi:FxLYD domain-containing protein [Mesotoga sp.]|uniref:FxLYD domain-containing protein n=1 Tax=Mesotoga sp. TaxID=2053577 RepID=UPI00345E513E
MKRLFLFSTAILLLAVFLSSCFQPQKKVEVIDLGNVENSKEIIFLTQEDSGEYVFLIRAPDSFVEVDGEFIGKMTYWVDYDTKELVVNHTFESDWMLTELWLGYSLSVQGLDKNGDGELEKDDLDDHVIVNPKSANFTYRKSLESFIQEDTTVFYFGVHLFLEKEVEENVFSSKLFKYEHGVCKFHVTYFNENGQKDPWLNGFIDGDAKGSKSGEYDWILTKTASPTVVPNFPSSSGSEKQIEYILEAKRLPLKEGTTFSISGSAGVLNTGDATAKNVQVELQLQKSVGATWQDIGSPKMRSLGDIDPGYKSVPFSFSFSGNEGDYFRVSMKITSDNFPTTFVYETFLMPKPAEMQPLDANATVEDQPFPPTGFEVLNHSSAGWPWNIADTSLATKTYFVTIRSIEQLQAGEYWLTNTATLTESDTKDKRVDDAIVQIIVIGGSEDSGTLQATTTHEIVWNREIEYDWELEKRVLPDSVTLTQGASQTFVYTLSATRLETPVASGSDVHSLTGEVEVLFTSTGITTADNLKIHVQLESSINGSDWSTEGATVSVDTSSKNSFSSGEEHTYPFSIPGFTPIEGKFYRVTAYVKADGPFPTQDTSDHSGPHYPNITKKYDEEANVDDLLDNIEDVIGNSVTGFSITDIVSHPSWPTDISTNTKYVYSIRIENIGADQGTYFLTNNATLTEKDSKTGHSDDARLIVTVPQPSIDNPNLKIENEHDMEWDKEKVYSWEIDKSVDPESVELEEGEDGTFLYTLLATRTVSEETNVATLTGLATVTNTGDIDLTNINVEIVLKDADDNEIDSYTGSITTLVVGTYEDFPYSFTFDPTLFSAPFTLVATATDGASDTHTSNPALPANPNLTEIDKDAFVEDEFDDSGIPAGIELGFPQSWTDMSNIWTNIIEGSDWNSSTNSWSVSYTVVATNTGAAPGEYPLDNTVVIYGEDSKDGLDSDDEEVTIIVPETVKLSAEVAAEFFWIRENIYEWEIDKKANPTQIIFQVNEFEKKIEYTITATKTLDSVVDTHSYSGSVKVTNNGKSEAQEVKLTITLQYYDGSNWMAIQTLQQVALGSIASGGDKTYGFGPIAFTPVDTSAQHRLKVEVSADAPANTDEEYDDSFLSITETSETNSTAVLNDEFTNVPDGFAIVERDPDPFAFPMNLTDSAVVQFSITMRKFSFEGSGSISSEYPGTTLGSYISATVTGYMAGTYPGWCTQVNVSGIGGPYTILDIYEGGAPSTQMAKINYILNRYRDGNYPGVDYRHIQIAIWAIMKGSLDWSSWRKMFDPKVPDGDGPLVQAIIDTAEEDFLPGCGDVVLMRALSKTKQDIILEIIFPCEEEEFRLENTATLTSELQKIWGTTQ